MAKKRGFIIQVWRDPGWDETIAILVRDPNFAKPVPIGTKLYPYGDCLIPLIYTTEERANTVAKEFLKRSSYTDYKLIGVEIHEE